MNAPGLLGSLEVLFNPTGLVQSVGAGVRDLVHMPLAGIHSGSAQAALQGFIFGSASLLRHMSGWTFISIAGFASSVSRILVIDGLHFSRRCSVLLCILF